MSFKQNKTNINLNGRPKGSQNKEKLAIKEFVTDLIDSNRDLIYKDFQTLKPKERLQVFTNLLKFIIPIQKEFEETNEPMKPFEFTIIDKNDKI